MESMEQNAETKQMQRDEVKMEEKKHRRVDGIASNLMDEKKIKTATAGR